MKKTNDHRDIIESPQPDTGIYINTLKIATLETSSRNIK
jgi:hypothetical protein